MSTRQNPVRALSTFPEVPAYCCLSVAVVVKLVAAVVYDKP